MSILLDATAPGSTLPFFSPPITIAAGNSPYAVAVGDFNGDGLLDITVANLFVSTVSVLLNTTSPPVAFSAQTTLATGAGSSPASVAVGDFNGDGKPDLALSNYGSKSVSVFLNTTPAGATAPTFAASVTFTSGTNPLSVTAADFNGDGKLDLVVANSSTSSSSVSVLLNTTTPGATAPLSPLQRLPLPWAPSRFP